MNLRSITSPTSHKAVNGKAGFFLNLAPESKRPSILLKMNSFLAAESSKLNSLAHIWGDLQESHREKRASRRARRLHTGERQRRACSEHRFGFGPPQGHVPAWDPQVRHHKTSKWSFLHREYCHQVTKPRHAHWSILFKFSTHGTSNF